MDKQTLDAGKVNTSVCMASQATVSASSALTTSPPHPRGNDCRHGILSPLMSGICTQGSLYRYGNTRMIWEEEEVSRLSRFQLFFEDQHRVGFLKLVMQRPFRENVSTDLPLCQRSTLRATQISMDSREKPYPRRRHPVGPSFGRMASHRPPLGNPRLP